LTSNLPSELRDAPSRPPVVWALAVYSTFSTVVVMVDSLAKEGGLMRWSSRDSSFVACVFSQARATPSESERPVTSLSHRLRPTSLPWRWRIDAVGELCGLGVRGHCCLFEARHARALRRAPDDLAWVPSF